MPPVPSRRARPAAALAVASSAASFAAALALACSPARRDPAPVTTDRVAAFEGRLEALRAELKIPAFSAAMGHDGQVVWAKGFGLADVERGTPATPATTYPIASLTKTFASTIIMQLVEEGTLDLDAPVSRYGITFERPDTVRLRHLLSHTSEGTPGAAYKYNGGRYARLDTVIARATGRSFGDLLMERIVRPLGLTRTAPIVLDTFDFRRTGLDSATFAAYLAKPYALDSAGTVVPSHYNDYFGVSAGLASSALDVLRYAMALDTDRLLRAESKARAWAPMVSTAGDTLPYGLGWFTQRVNGERIVWHYGLWNAHSALLIKVPARRLSFVILANSDMLSKPFSLGAGDITVSPVARAFAETFLRGGAEVARGRPGER